MGVMQGNRILHPTKLSTETEMSIAEEFRGGVGATQIGRLRGIAYTLVVAALKRHGLKPESNEVRQSPAQDILHSRQEEVLSAYRLYSAVEAAKKFGVSAASLRTFVRSLGLPRQRISHLEQLADDIVRRWIEGEAKVSIARAYDINKTTVTKILRRHCPKGLLAPGPQHWKWKGGKRTNRLGYVVVTMFESHPFFEAMHYRTGRVGGNTPGSNFVFEHRLVMAEHLGRPLLPSETVHHIDGNRANNDIVNLQLRISNHGPGIVMQCRQCGSHDVIPIPIANSKQANKDHFDVHDTP
jgi:hypothetical protein